MCEWLKKLFGGVTQVQTLPHSEQPKNESATANSVSVHTLLEDFFIEYQVPAEYHPFWESIEIELIDNLYVPAETYSSIKIMRLDPKFANTGVIAHEFAHISYSLLNDMAKGYFQVAYDSVQNDSMIKLLHSQNTYMDSTIVEAHAEVYRFLGLEMPNSLKPFYPKLI